MSQTSTQISMLERMKLPLNQRYVGFTFEGSKFPNAIYRNDLNIELRPAEINEYLPVLNEVAKDRHKGLRLLLTCMTHQEEFSVLKVNGVIRQQSRSYRTNNPGNIGNTDNGKNFKYPTLVAGVTRQVKFLDDIIANKVDSYPYGHLVDIKPDYSEEIHNHPEYGLPYNLPGYKFIFTGQLDQYVKIYATGARAGNGYINRIVSYFKQNGITITAENKIQDIVLLD